MSKSIKRTFERENETYFGPHYFRCVSDGSLEAAVLGALDGGFVASPPRPERLSGRITSAAYVDNVQP
jgi:hypothetical protein